MFSCKLSNYLIFSLKEKANSSPKSEEGIGVRPSSVIREKEILPGCQAALEGPTCNPRSRMLK